MSLLEPDEPFKSQRPSFFSWGCLSSVVGIIVAGVAVLFFINQTHPFTDTPGGTLVYGMTVYDAIGSGGEDAWTFQGQQGDMISVRMDGGFDTYLSLEDSDGRELTSNDDGGGDDLNARIDSFTLPSDGTYTIIARGYNNSSTGSYSLELEQLTATQVANAQPTASAASSSNGIAPTLLAPNLVSTIEYGATVSGNVQNETGDEWTFQGNESDTVTIDMTSNFDNYLVLYDSDNRQLTYDDDSGEGNNASIENYTLPYDGTYTILARGFGGRTGSYELSLSSSDTIAPTAGPSRAGTIEYGQTVSGSVRTDAGESWTFRGNEGDIVVIDMVGDFDTFLILFDSDNRQLMFDDDGGEDNNSRIAFYTLPYDGSYTIVAQGWAGHTGDYQLTLNTSDNIPPTPIPTDTPAPSRAGTIEYGQTVSGSVQTSAGEYWTFRGNEGDIVTIDMVGDFDTYLLLFDSDNRQLTYDDDGGDDNNARISFYTLPNDGSYTVVARGWAGHTGNYQLMLNTSDSIPTTTPRPTDTPTPLPRRAGDITYGQTVTGNINDFSGDAWTFQGQAGDRVTINLTGDFDTYLILSDSDYRQLTYDDDGGDDLNSRIRSFRLTRDGEYIIIARGYSGNTGSYSLTLQN